MKKVTVTYNGINKPGFQYNATVVKIDPEVRTLDNDNKTPYHLCTIEFVNNKDVKVQRTASIFASNLEKGITIGSEYMATSVREDNGNWYTQIAPFAATTGSTDDDFGFESESEISSKASSVIVNARESKVEA